jgi:predicted AlkP superfamily pyrophosphatase or phosphodiesterase
MTKALVLNVVGLTQRLISPAATPRIAQFVQRGKIAVVEPVPPAVTCPVQATYLTGRWPSEHGIVANGWYYRDVGEVALWKQSNRLVQGEKIWHFGRKKNGAFTCANSFWWFNMNTDVEWSVTPRPIYCANGLKLPDCYSSPPELRDEYNQKLGQFPLFKFWGPATTIESSEWIANSAMATEESYSPTLQLVYLPHLDYILQKVGPDGELAKDLGEIDALCGRLIDFFRGRGVRVVVLSEYGITPVKRPIHVNRALRDAGLLAVKVDLEREYLDPGRCRAFAVADHQIAHVYVDRPSDVPAVKKLLEALDGVEHVLDDEGKRAFGLDHERSGELVLVAAADAWFTYYFWNDDARAPDYARTVNIHAKPGYDPCELFIDPRITFPKLAVGATLAKKILGFRYLMEVIPLDATLVKGSHGRVTDRDEDGPLFMTSEPKLLNAPTVASTDVCGLVLDHVFAS